MMIRFTSSLLQGEGDRDTASFPGEVRLHPVHHLGGPGGEERGLLFMIIILGCHEGSILLHTHY